MTQNPVRIEADYLIETPSDPRLAAETMAGEQSSGTFVAVPGETPELKARAALTVTRLRAMPGVSVVAPDAAFYVMPRVALPPGRTDEHYVKALLHATGVLCVYGSGFGLPAEDGFLRIVFLSPLADLTEIYDLMANFTAQYVQER